MASLRAWLRSAKSLRGAALADAMCAMSACASGHLAGVADRAAAAQAQKEERELAEQLASIARPSRR